MGYSDYSKVHLPISSALSNAERQHLLESPNADFLTRTSALVLDIVLLRLLLTSVKECQNWLAGFILFLSTLPTVVLWAIAVFFFVLKAGLVYLYFVWPVSVYGGTPAKLVLGIVTIHSKTGNYLSPVQACLRELLLKPLSLVSFGFLWALVRSDALTLHDLISRSVVKKKRGRG